MTDIEAKRQEKRGWFWPPSGSRRAHYFDGDSRAVCGRFMLWPGVLDSLDARNFEDVGDESPDNCASCKRAVAKLRSGRIA